MTDIYSHGDYDYDNSDTDDDFRDNEAINGLRQGVIYILDERDPVDPVINPDDLTFEDIGESSMGEAIISTEEDKAAFLNEIIYKISSGKSDK